MSTWNEDNSRYLSAVCNSLRLSLRRAAGDKTVTTSVLAAAEAATTAAAAVEPPPAAIALSQRFRLTELETGILLLCVAMEIDPDIPELCDRAQGNRGWAFPTFALGFKVFEQVRWDVMSMDTPLRYWRLIELHSTQPQPLPMTMLKADEHVVNYCMGTWSLDYRLATLVMPVGPPGDRKGTAQISSSQVALVEDLSQGLAEQATDGSLPIVQLLGANLETKYRIAQAVTAQFEMQLFGLMGELIPTAQAEFIEFQRLWERETHLSSVALFIDTQELSSEHQSWVALRRFLSHCHGLIFVDSRDVRLPPHRAALTREVAKPTPAEQRQAWTLALGPDAKNTTALLTSQFNLNLAEIADVAATPRPVSPTIPALEQHLWTACLNRTLPHLESLAQRLDVKATWEQLVLPEEAMGVLRQIVDQVQLRTQVYEDWGLRERMNRGLGVSAMFAGESGTGKTMAAEVLANALNLHLYRIDLSSVVSKYIGETEKNLRRLFDAAEEGGTILFFDEADALFGKRSEVRDSHDRYANIEINYLLQRIESYQGLAILATNLKGSLDPAFLRRLRFLINFPFPSREYRQELWRKVFPDKMPTGLIDYAYLSQFNITGGTIHTIAINAAFMAAEQGEPVGMSQILASIRTEYQKLDRQIYDAEFQWDRQEQAARDWESPPQEILTDV